jgi:hypothetical protein
VIGVITWRRAHPLRCGQLVVARWQARWLGRLGLALGVAIVIVAVVLVRGL